MWLFQRDRRSDVGPRVRGIRRFEAGVEGMEGRLLLTGSGAVIILSGTTIEVIGSNYGDTGVVSLQNGSVDVNVSNSHGSDNVLFPASQVDSIDYFGGSGDNSFTNATSLTGFLCGGSGNNILNGGSGSDFLLASSSGTNILNAGSGVETLEAAGSGTNILKGGSGYDTMYAFSGNNQIVGGSGSTYIIAIGGQNSIDGGTGNSIVYSFSSTDAIVPRAGETIVHIGY
jgi:Ca2+-binding RTX toxin-like protein